MALYDEEGNLVEGALTPDEAAQKIKETAEQTKTELETELEDLKVELEITKTELSQKEAELQKTQDKGQNWKNLREEKEKKEKEAEELKKKIEDIGGEITKLKSESTEKSLDVEIKTLAGGNKELAEKIKYHYKSFAGEPENEEKRQERLNSAVILATGGKSTTKTGGTFGSGEGMPPNSGLTPEQKLKKLDNPESINVAKKLGITEEQAKKSDLI